MLGAKKQLPTHQHASNGFGMFADLAGKRPEARRRMLVALFARAGGESVASG